MKNTLFFIATLLLTIGSINCFAQSEATSPRMSFSITKEVKPPLWEIVEEPYFVDADGNHAIDANENCKIVMKLKNVGMGDGTGLTAKISATGTTNGIIVKDQKLSTIKVGSTATVEFPFSTNMNTADGTVVFSVYVDEPLGFSTERYTVQVQTRQFQAPMIVVKDFLVLDDKGGNLTKQKPFNLQILLQNIQQGLGEDVTVKLSYPDNVFNISGQDLFTYKTWAAGETQTLNFQLVVNAWYEGSTLPLKVIITEKYGKYSQNMDINLTLNQPLASKLIPVNPDFDTIDIADVQLRSDVDRNIPQMNKKNSHRYALVIGNQDYHSYQRGLNSEQDVPFATEDARVFKQYCEKTLGVKEDNIVLLTDATAAKMNQEVDFITNLAAMDPDAEIIFYYAGHGFPDETSKVPYLIPVDVNASSLYSAIPLYDLYDKLCSTGATRVTVFLDACFSGGGRDAGLVASRGIKVTPKKDALNGNIVVFSATSADQTALPYNEKYHGMFTYYLLKKLQESNGECSYSELYEYLNQNVGSSSLRVNRKKQNPEVNMAPQVQESWGSWKFLGN